MPPATIMVPASALKGSVMGERGPQPGEGGRPPIPIDLDVVRRAAGIGCSAEEIAVLVGVGRRTLFDHLKQDEALQTAIDEGRAQGRVTLRRLQWQQAHAGNPTMLIWLGKQLLGQKDRHELAGDPERPVAVEFRWADSEPAPQPDLLTI